METIHAAGRRRLPPVPRVALETAGSHEPAPGTTDDAATERLALPAEAAAAPVGAVRRHAGTDQDAGQQFVARLRAAADDFAAAAGAISAVVREAVPPARHRRARCRLVLRSADGTETDVLLLGPAGAPGSPSRHGFDRQIRRWLSGGLLREDSWLVPDPDAPDGVAVDVAAWVARS